MSSPKVRIYELSKVLGTSNKQIMVLLEKEFGLDIKSHSSSIDQDVANALIERFKERMQAKAPATTATSPAKQAAPPASQPPASPSVKPPATTASQRPPQQQPGTYSPQRPQQQAQPPSQRPVSQQQPPSGSQQAAASSRNPVSQNAPSQSHPAQGNRPPAPPAEAKRPFSAPPSAQPSSHASGHAPGHAHGGSSAQSPASSTAANVAKPSPPSFQNPNQPPKQGLQPNTPTGRPPERQAERQGDRQQGDRQAEHHSASRPFSSPSPHTAPSSGAAGSSSAPNRPAPPSRPQQHGGQHSGSGRSTHPHSGQPPSGARTATAVRPKPSRTGTPSPERQAEAMAAKAEAAKLAEKPEMVRIDHPMTITELGKLLHLKETEIIKHLFMKGVMVTINQTLDVDFCKSVAKEFEIQVEEIAKVKNTEDVSTLVEKKDKLDESKYHNLEGRPPVISIMGHVDHGKTSLLDAIRETRHQIVDTEAGGITQSIGAYSVDRNGSRVIFLDTPGHEAFTAMRMRGAKSTDIAILVVAADDGVMPQTLEAISHAKAAGIPIIVAVNKVDKPGADPDRVLVQLSEHGLVSEKWGGDVVTVEVSALQRLGIDDLLEMIALVSELLELKADPTVPGEGVIIESQLDRRKGPTATALVQNGKIRVGDNVLVGSVSGRVRALINDYGERIEEAGPSTPVEILGLEDVPKAGDFFRVIYDDKAFKQLSQDEKVRDREQRLESRARQGVLARGSDAMRQMQEATEQEVHDFNVIVKADTQGAAEAVTSAVQQLSTDLIRVNLIHSGTGEISEADVMLASASQALIVGFNVNEAPNAERIAESERVRILKFDVIYHIQEQLEKLMLGKLSPETKEVMIGRAEIRQLFTAGKSVIAGCMVQEGKLVRNCRSIVTRANKEVYSGPLTGLRRFKDEVKEVSAGYECGLSFDKFNDLQVGDVVTGYITEAQERTSLSS
ncbi:MAG: translation initiation factor IF-2 [Candidatus Melainabacteria bacterium]|nr:translation initiation factor IF-2 [Candidatus Melainabacteria bacterium]